MLEDTEFIGLCCPGLVLEHRDLGAGGMGKQRAFNQPQVQRSCLSFLLSLHAIVTAKRQVFTTGCSPLAHTDPPVFWGSLPGRGPKFEPWSQSWEMTEVPPSSIPSMRKQGKPARIIMSKKIINIHENLKRVPGAEHTVNKYLPKHKQLIAGWR